VAAEQAALLDRAGQFREVAAAVYWAVDAGAFGVDQSANTALAAPPWSVLAR
jgi:hypothetical protein